MPAPRLVLVVDPDPETEASVAPALRRRGYLVCAARDGSRALELAILRSPDLVLLDDEAPLVDAPTFVRILRANPRTERIPVVMTGHREEGERVHLGQYLRKPFDAGAVLACVEHVLRRADTAGAVASDAGLEGDLAQLPLADLLQLLAMNRRTGRLELEAGSVRGEVELAEGSVAGASAGAAAGEKALFRLLAVRAGRFTFSPGPPRPGGGTGRRVDELVLEGMRQADELARLLPAAPRSDDLLALAVAPALVPEGLHPVTAEVVGLLVRPRTLQDVLDRAAATDLEALRAVTALLDRGYVRRERARAADPSAPPRAVLSPQELHALHGRMARGRDGGAPPVGKLVVAGGGPLARRAALARFDALPGFSAEAAGAQVAFGTLGRLDLGEGLRIELVALPADPALAPLWRPFAAGALGVLVHLPADEVAAPVAELAHHLGVPVGACGPADALPPALRDLEGGCALLGGDPAAALGALLAACAAREAPRSAATSTATSTAGPPPPPPGRPPAR
jgi:DNA-binding response OmpR family regulator